MKKLISISIFLLVSNLFVFAQETPPFITDSLDIYVKRSLEQWQIPGAAVLIVKDGKIIVAKGYGVKELGTSDKVDENTLFMIGSNTKAFTGTALALLEHEGKLKLEDKVVQYLPDFKMTDPWINKELNIQDIVSHRMGFETFQGDFMYWSSDLTADEVIEKFGMLTPKFDFRTKYGYTNAGYTIAGKIIEKVSGYKWAEYIREKIFLPLKMNSTTALLVDFSKSENVAKPHTILNEELKVLPFSNIDNMAPAGSICTSVSDMSNWLIAQLDSGSFEKIKVLPHEVIERTRKPQTFNRIINRNDYPFNKSNFSIYAMGWGLMDYEGKQIVSHSGGTDGFLSSVTLVPEENLGIAVFTNNDQNDFYWALKLEILDAFLRLPYRNYNDHFFKEFYKVKGKKIEDIVKLQDSVRMNIKIEISLEEFAGKYVNELYGFTVIKQRENHLELYFEHHPKLTAKLEYIGNKRFLCTFSDPMCGIKVIPFKIENEKVISFYLIVDDYIDPMPYLFVKE